ncbi:hypothetical protein KPH14_002289 [Odynerus spinipes]|uniref:Nose resistant-to-fluoxetine protein N-terminal domain-containing protein n=1 Tax=Odynerus spinipes TaxID=1348599 RepID=A0AAD9RL84_9HYME|nr:hypothetical protein KPH14_002289 [Odynerus spinipes]
MIPRSLVFCLLFILTNEIAAEEKAIFKTEALVEALKSYTELRYDTYNESNLPLLSRDVILLKEAIDLIENEKCRSQCQFILNGLKNLTEWAVKFYDASGKFPEGVLAGSVYHLGNFDECLDIGQNEETPANIRGRYCLGEVTVKVPEAYLKRHDSVWQSFRPVEERSKESISELYWGICIPAACTPQDVEDVAGRVLAVAFSESRLKLTPRILEGSCSDGTASPVTTNDVVYICLILSVISIVTAGTIFHVVYLTNKISINGALPQVLIAFSVISNLKKIFGPAHDDDLHLSFISGIRFISMLLITAGHTLIFVASGPLLNIKFWEQGITNVENSVLLNSPLLVDTFLILSGFLFCRLLLRELDKRKSVNILLLYVFRYIRLTPAYFVMIGLYVTWLTKLGSGPLWYKMVQEQKRCLSSWWANLLYINNYIDTANLCMFQSWYLAVDTQLFIIAPIIIYPLWKWPTIGKYLLFSGTIFSTIIPFVVTFVEKLDPTLMVYISEIKDLTSNTYFINAYIKTHMRAEAYFFGLAFGYILYRIQTSDYKFSKNLVRLGWFFATLSLCVSMFSIPIFYGPRQDFTAIEASIYASLHRALWSLGTGWLLLACATDNSGPISKILRWRPFSVLSRLTYAAYLVNGFVVTYYLATTRTPQYLSIIHLFGITLSHWMCTFLGALLLSTIFESPIIAFEQILLRFDKQETKMKATEETNASGT